MAQPKQSWQYWHSCIWGGRGDREKLKWSSQTHTIGNIGINSNFILYFHIFARNAHVGIHFNYYQWQIQNGLCKGFCQIVGWLTLPLWGVLVSVNSGFFSPSRFSHFHCNAVRKAIKVAENLHTNQQNEHIPETFKMQKGPIYIN